MPRQARIDAPGLLHHVICRGTERRSLFIGDEDYDDFANRLQSVLTDTSTTCYAWALVPNHFHLLLRIGTTPLSTVMRRLLTGYAVAFNHRHNRSGHLFQNRFKSIVCQDDLYLLELVRYIHLNPLRAGLVDNVEGLSGFCESGHRQLLGLTQEGVVAVDDVLGLFGDKRGRARNAYAAFVADGADQGKRPDLVGGGLVRSLAGSSTQTDCKIDDRMVNDERLLGDGGFVAEVLREAELQMTTRQRLQLAGFGLEELIEVIADLLEIDTAEVCARGKQPQRVKARSLLCYWAVRELGMSATALGRELGISQPAVSQAVQRGERLVREKAWELGEMVNL